MRTVLDVAREYLELQHLRIEVEKAEQHLRIEVEKAEMELMKRFDQRDDRNKR
jgi:hypothetical protein